MRRLAIVSLVLCAAGLVAAPASTAKRRVPYGFYGVNFDREVRNAPDEAQAAQWPLMAASGVEAARVAFSWRSLQPVRGGGLDFTSTDRIVANAALRRITLLPVLGQPPAWARAYPGGSGSPPAHPRQFAALAGALVRRYGPRGSFWRLRPDLPRRPIRTWQVLNEPHFINPWYTSTRRRLRWPTGYTRLLRVTYRAIKRRDRHARVVLAGLTNRAWDHLRRLYRAGAGRYFDVAAIHPYTGSPRNVLRAVRRFRATMRRYGGRRDRRKPIWVTETTWSAGRGRVDVPPFYTWVTTDSGMARQLGAVYRLLIRHRRERGVGLTRVYWYTWASSYRATGDLPVFAFSGLIEFDGGGYSEKPAFFAYRASARHYEGCQKDASGGCL